MERSERKEFLSRLYETGIVMAMVFDDARWVGVRENGGFTLVEGQAPDSTALATGRRVQTYSEAIDAFGDWWGEKFPPLT